MDDGRVAIAADMILYEELVKPTKYTFQDVCFCRCLCRVWLTN